MLKRYFRAKGVLLLSGLLILSLMFMTCSQETAEEQQSQQQTEQMSQQSEQAETPGEAPEPEQPEPTESAEETSSPQAQQQAQAQQQQASAQASQQEQQMAPLNIELPKAMFVGTPTNMNVPNLQKPRGEARPPFMAPVGTENVALEQPVSSSDPMPIIGELTMVTDGDKSAADGHYVELGPFQQQVTIDLGAMQNIYAVVLWHFHKQPRVYFDVIVQVADDPDFIENVQTIFNNDHDNSSGLSVGDDMNYVETNEGKLIDAKGVRGRYVRCYSNGNNSNDLNHYIEVAVFGKPAPAM